MIAAATSPLGTLASNPVSRMLGTDYQSFRSPTGLCGLVHVTDGGIELLAVHALAPNQGQFREFIRRCKAQYDYILVLEIWNKALKNTLRRYDFQKWNGERYGEQLEGMIWRRKSEA